MIKYIVDVGDLKIHEVEFMQDGDILKQVNKVSDTMRLLQNIVINQESVYFDKIDWHSKTWVVTLGNNIENKKRFDIYDEITEAEERLKELLEVQK